MLKLSAERAELNDGQSILELGCGWGSFTLFMAKKFPNSKITAVSNSKDQRKFIKNKCEAKGLDNINVITADMNDFSIEKSFAIYTLSLKLIFYFAWMYKKGCASKPQKKSLQVNPKYNFNGHKWVLKY